MEEGYPEIPEFLKELIDTGEALDEIMIDREGNWFHNNEPFTNKRIKDFFNRHLDVTSEGVYVISYNRFVYPITVEDVPLFVTGVRFIGNGISEKTLITISSSIEEELDIDTLQYNKKNNALYCHVKNGKLPAKFKRSPSFQVLERLEESDDTFYLNISGKKIVLSEKMNNE
ncbi:MAG: DUF1285 domain-containing protein [Spirochaetota bacterium]|nr:DUF1285 domain-containing protein [Spirochaetota bacterium]